MTAIQTDARNADMATIKSILEDQRARRVDLVCSATAMRFDANANLLITGQEPLLGGDGVTDINGQYQPTATFDSGLAGKLGIAVAYLRKCREERPYLYADNAHAWLHGNGEHRQSGESLYPADKRKFLLRLLKGDDGELGVARAMLSQKFRVMDNLDVLLAVLAGAREAGIDVMPGTCDLSNDRMYVRLEAPHIAATAPRLLAGYRSPFDLPGGGVSRAGQDRPGYRFRGERGNWEQGGQRAAQALGTRARQVGDIVWAGLVVSNSDTGGGARSIAPQIRVLTCTNGLTRMAMSDRKVHLGSNNAEGIIDWSAATQERELELITAQTKDAVAAFLSQSWLDEQVAAIEELAGQPLVAQVAQATIAEVSKAAGFTKPEADAIWEHFLMGGQGTAGGVANAVTSVAQTLPSGERQAELERKALDAMAHAARLSR